MKTQNVTNYHFFYLNTIKNIFLFYCEKDLYIFQYKNEISNFITYEIVQFFFSSFLALRVQNLAKLIIFLNASNKINYLNLIYGKSLSTGKEALDSNRVTK